MANTLQHIDEFKKLLISYRVSESTKKILEHTKLVLFVGPSSSGRNTIINELLKSGDYHYIVSDTTRKPRENNGILEQDGREYWFRSEDQMLAEIRAGELLEAAVIHSQQVSGISIRELQAAAEGHKIAVNEVEVAGADNIHAAKPDTIFFFIVPPSVDEWLTRMKMRGELPADEIRRRLESAVEEIQIALNKDYYWFVVNETFIHTARDINQIIVNHTISSKQQSQGRRTAEQVLADIKVYLAN